MTKKGMGISNMHPLAKCGALVKLTKQIIRSKILKRLKTQKEEDRNSKSSIIKGKLFRTRVFVKAKTVMFYYPLGGEVDTQEMMKQAYNSGKIIAVPSVPKRRAIRPCLFEPGMRLKRGLYGTKEPATKKFINLRNIDLVIVPGVAFDQKGNRLGRGKGCYDVFLNKLPKSAVSLGLAFDFQILPFIPATAQDVRLNRVLFA